MSGAEPQNLAPNMLAAYENARLLRVRTEREQLALAKARGDLVSRAAVTDAMHAVFAMLRQQILGMAAQLGPQVVGCELEEATAVIESYCHRLLGQLSATTVLERATEGSDEPSSEDRAA
jgi:flagellar biosynthesis/type III secretory pathway protein FliH